MGSKRDGIIFIVACLLLIEFMSGLGWGIHRGLTSLFTREILLVTSFTRIGFVVSVFGLTKALTNLGSAASRTGSGGNRSSSSA